MSDDLNQIGKHLNETRKEANEALAKEVPHRPTIETVRDVFDNVVPFVMLFKRREQFPTVLLNLEFFGPPPNIGCCADCYCTVCQPFYDQTSSVLQLYRAYLPDTVSVYINNARVTTFVESSPTDGVVTLTQPLTGAALVKVCYIYSYCE